MTVNTPNTSSLSQTWASDDEIDLRRYINTLARWWREIIAIMLGAIVLAIIFLLIARLLTPPRYEASADVAIVRTVSDVKFDERFLTTSDDLTASSANTPARRSALLGLVTASAIAQEVLNQLGDKLTVADRNTTALLGMVKVTMASGTGGGDSDLIRISVQAGSSTEATAIANAWAQAYVRAANAIYGQVPDEVLNSIKAELAAAQNNYMTAQANLEAFVANNHIDELTGLVTVSQQRINQEITLLQAYLEQWQQTMEQISASRALHEQVGAGGEGAARSSMAALQLLKMSIYGMTPEKFQVEVRDIPQVTQQAMLVDIEGLQKSLNARLQDLENQIAIRNNGLHRQEITSTVPISMSNSFPAISQTYQEMQTLKAQLEAENARQLQLTQQRDLSWETFKTLSTKVTELNLARAAASSEVRFAASAVPSIGPITGLSITLVTAVAGTLGLVLGIFAILIAEYMGKTPFLFQRQ